MNYIPLLGFNIADITMAQLLKKIDQWVHKKEFKYLVTLNPEILVNLKKHPDLDQFIKDAAICFADGTGLIQASRVLNKKVPKKITGSDLTIQLLSQKKYSFYIVGAAPTTIEKAVSLIKTNYPGSRISGSHHGFYTDEEEYSIIADIIRKEPQIILVGMGFPKQDLFIKKLKASLKSGLAVGIGGMIDILAQEQKRAPRWTQKCGVEWIYRGIQQPKRILRWIFIPVFLLLVMQSWFLRKKN